METIDRLLEKSCYVIDFIPTQVARESKYNPDEEMCILLKDIVVSGGMFLRKGC